MRVSDSILFPNDSNVGEKAGGTDTRKAQDQASSVGFSQDLTDFSTDPQKVQELKTQLANLPDVRQERVQELRKAVQDGTYEVSTDKIADAMLADLASK